MTQNENFSTLTTYLIRTFTKESLVCVAGPLTQWELIFYGTETPAQEYDASPESNSAGTSVTSWNANVPEIPEERQNTIDDDLALVWHDSHAVSNIRFSLQLSDLQVGPTFICYFVLR